MNKIKYISLIVILLYIVVSFLGIKSLRKDIVQLKEEKEQCLITVDKYKEQILSIRLITDTNNDVIVKYNSQKKKEYKNETDGDLAALHNLDVLLEQKSIIK